MRFGKPKNCEHVVCGARANLSLRLLDSSQVRDKNLYKKKTSLYMAERKVRIKSPQTEAISDYNDTESAGSFSL